MVTPMQKRLSELFAPPIDDATTNSLVTGVEMTVIAIEMIVKPGATTTKEEYKATGVSMTTLSMLQALDPNGHMRWTLPSSWTGHVPFIRKPSTRCASAEA
jgi:hypothetical protein